MSPQTTSYISAVAPSDDIYSDKQHLAQLLGVGGLYAAKGQVQMALAPAPGVQRSILDLGKFIVSLNVKC